MLGAYVFHKQNHSFLFWPVPGMILVSFPPCSRSDANTFSLWGAPSALELSRLQQWSLSRLRRGAQPRLWGLWPRPWALGLEAGVGAPPTGRELPPPSWDRHGLCPMPAVGRPAGPWTGRGCCKASCPWPVGLDRVSP